MKKFTKLILCVVGAILFAGCATDTQKANYKSLESGFVAPPDSIQTSVYWYWISDNISKEGVVNDLHSMKQAGINRAFIGNIGQDNVPYGSVKMFSDEWWEILHTALKTATELDIEIGIFNSPGWSQSGGPWVQPEEAMRYLTTSEHRVSGPRKITMKLEKPADIFQDVRLLVYPAPRDYDLVFDSRIGKITSVPAIAGLHKIIDGDNKTGISLPGTNKIILNFEAREPFTARSLSVQVTEHPLSVDMELQVKEEGGTFRTLSEFKVDRSNAELNVGFDPYAPVVISIPATTSKFFRLVVMKPGQGSGLAEVTISASPRVERYSEKTLAKMHQTPLPYWHEYQWLVQPEVDDPSLIVNASSVINISEYLTTDGTVVWDVPEGDWIILRTGMTPTGTKNSPASPESTGYEIDKMSKKHVRKHFHSYMGEILERIPEADRKCFKVVVQDSYETGGQNFTDDFIEKFADRYGYDPVPYLPVYKGLVVNSRLESDRFLWDMRRLVADMVAYDYVGGLRDVSHEHGLRTWLENYGHWGFPGEFLMYGGQSDEIGGEFWSEGSLGDIENRAASSCGHIYGKRKISAESNTCAGNPFFRYPAMLKQRGDRFFAEGINNTLLHVYISQPYEDKEPGINAWFGNEFNRKNTWFSQIDIYIQYLKRCNYMLQQGLNVADVAYFIGEDAPKMTGLAEPSLPGGYQFDYMNAEVIEKYMTVKDGLITLPHGTQYKMLVLPPQESMRPELLKKIKQLVYDGAVVLGSPPRYSPSLQNQPAADGEVRKLAGELWRDADGVNVRLRKYGKGMILNGMGMEEALRVIDCVPDCRLPGDGSIHYGHRALKSGEIYFVSNQTDEPRIVSPGFRVEAMQPELWDPVTGFIRDLPAYEQRGKTTIVPLKLEPYESVFVVFHKKAGKTSHTGLEANYPEPELITALNGPWTVTFDTEKRGPAGPVVFETLQDWSASADDLVRYYSGTAVYSCKFNMDELTQGRHVITDLGSVTAMAKIKVNGEYAGGVWTAPYRVDITKLVRAGENLLEIEVVNTWVNRLIGDQNLPDGQRQTWCSINPYNADSSLQSSGLSGPVVVLSVSY